jgi:glutamine synthetase
MTTAKDVLKMIKENDVKYVDLRFTDPRGKWQHVTFDITMIDEEIFAEGTMFDGSSIAGWKAINESDMLLMLDPSTAQIDPFFAETTLSIVCDVLEPSTGEPYNRDPRGIAKKAEAYLKSTKIGDTIYRRPRSRVLRVRRREVLRRALPHRLQGRLLELPTNSDTDYEGGNLGHRIRTKGGYFPVPPIDSAAGHARRDARLHGQDGREGREASPRGGLGPARARHEVRHARRTHGRPDAGLQVLHPSGRQHPTARRRPSCRSRSTATTARACTCTSRSGRAASRSSPATSMPTSARSASGTSAASSSTPSRSTPSPTRRPTPTSVWSRAIEAPVLLAYSARNRSASCRIPWTNNPKAKRVEVRFPDPTANPYLAFAAMLMAGLDGITNKIDPGSAMDKDLYDLPPKELKKIPTVCGSLREALQSLDKDRAFLKAGGVFNDDFRSTATSS